MIREAKATDCVELQKLSFEDLGYECDAELVKIRLENSCWYFNELRAAFLSNDIIGMKNCGLITYIFGYL